MRRWGDGGLPARIIQGRKGETRCRLSRTQSRPSCALACEYLDPQYIAVMVIGGLAPYGVAIVISGTGALSW